MHSQMLCIQLVNKCICISTYFTLVVYIATCTVLLGIPYKSNTSGMLKNSIMITTYISTKTNATLASCVTLLYSLSHGMINQYAGRAVGWFGCNCSHILVLVLDKTVCQQLQPDKLASYTYRSHTIKEDRASVSDRTQKTGYREQH